MAAPTPPLSRIARHALLGHPVPQSVAEAATAPEFLPMTIATLNDALSEWLAHRVRPGLTRVAGGWEEWAQLDLIGQLNDNTGSTPHRRWDVERLARVYQDPDRRADLLFNAESHDATKPMLVVEILCESPLVPRPDFLNRMHFEAEHLRAQYLLPRYATARRMILALTLDLATSTALQRHDFGVVVCTPEGYSAMWREMGG